MEFQNADERLSQISTQWTLLQQAHDGPADVTAAAQAALMQRYCGSAYRYLLGALRDEDAASELFQEFALRFVRGDFHRATPTRGRFRDYVKTVLIHLVSDYRGRQRDRPRPLPADYPEPQPTDAGQSDRDDFETSWREELIHQTWQTLQKAQPTFHALLLLHVEHPDMPSPEMAECLAAKLNKSLTAGNVRVMLHRARDKFADLLVKEVARSLRTSNREELTAEIRELRLLPLCESALARWRG